MITIQNIGDFIKYIYRLRNKSEAPIELIEKWKNIPTEELDIRLNQLYESWGYNTTQRQQLVEDFMRYQRVVTPKPNEAKNLDLNVSEATVMKKTSSWKKWLIGLGVFATISSVIYVGIQYYKFKRLHYIYTLTERVSIRNENKEQIGTMDMNPLTNGNSFQRLLAADNNIYNKAIDSSDKLYDHRKVFIKPPSFFEYLQNDPTIYGYVNAKFVVDSKEEFETYRKLFGQLNPSDNKRLQLKHRKVIANSLHFNKDLKNLYLLSSCKGASEKIRKNNLSFMVHEVIPDNKYEIIGKLSDGYYYQFIGDVLSNAYTAPRRIGYTENPNREDEYLNGDILFRYIPKSNSYVLTNCNGVQLPYKTILNTEGVVLYFEKQIEQPNAIEPLIDMGENAYDILKEVGSVVEKIFKKL